MINLSFGQRKFDSSPVMISSFPARMSYQAGRTHGLPLRTTIAENVQQAQHYQGRQMQAVSEKIFLYLYPIANC